MLEFLTDPLWGALFWAAIGLFCGWVLAIFITARNTESLSERSRKLITDLSGQNLAMKKVLLKQQAEIEQLRGKSPARQQETDTADN
jgi:hypothetical protein